MGTTENESFINYYDILKCERTATNEELKKSYQNLVRILHPDKIFGVESYKDEHFLLIQKAWTVLRDPTTRKQYDAQLSCQEYSDCLLYEKLNIGDLQYNAGEDFYEYPCRCGGMYLIQSTDLVPPKVIVGCDECSFSIEIKVS